jgi:hypothetical protein
MRNWLFGILGQILCEQFLWCQRKWWACSWICSSPHSPLSVSVDLDFLCTSHAFSPNACLVSARVSVALVPRFAHNLMLFILSDPSRSRLRPDTRLQIKGRKKIQRFHPTAWNFIYKFPRYGSTIIYHSIALLQLLYRWQHRSWKFWIPPLIHISAMTNAALTDIFHTFPARPDKFQGGMPCLCWHEVY